MVQAYPLPLKSLGPCHLFIPPLYFSAANEKSIRLEFEILNVKSSDYGMLEVIIETSLFIVQKTSSRKHLCFLPYQIVSKFIIDLTIFKINVLKRANN